MNILQKYLTIKIKQQQNKNIKIDVFWCFVKKNSKRSRKKCLLITGVPYSACPLITGLTIIEKNLEVFPKLAQKGPQ